MTRISSSSSSAFRVVVLVLSLHSVGGALTNDQLESFQREGYLYLRKFLFSSSSEDDTATFARLIQAGDALVQRAPPSTLSNRTFSTSETGLIFGVKDEICGVDVNGESECDQHEIVQAFRDVALRSKVVDVCAKLMQLDPSTQNMRILR